MLAIVLFQGCCSYAIGPLDNERLKVMFGWKQLDFQFPDLNTKRMAIASGAYVQANNMPVGLDVWNDKLFITVPRWKTGVWSTLNYVSLGKTNGTTTTTDVMIMMHIKVDLSNHGASVCTFYCHNMLGT